MANDTIITVVGNLTADPELRFTQSGVAVANFTIASTPRTFDKQANEWRDGEALFLRSTIWRDAAENVAESLEKGSRVIAQGRLVQRSFTDREGNNRTSIELDVDEIGPSLRYATAKPSKVDRRQGGGRAPQPSPQGEQWNGGYSQPQGAPNADPWAGGGNQGGYDDPPF
ncbi:single-stranded DNA-binding protein [Brachybacterium paraconglomeratum]|uniref:single-stranded DNA-binding protein n=1 Tax=Brachybacterium paraconglomeratum TaxID=173362 RepID=UPI0037CAACA3